MQTEIKMRGESIVVHAFIDLNYSAVCDSAAIACGPFILGLGNDSESRKALIAALQEADAELDAAIEARTAKTEVAA